MHPEGRLSLTCACSAGRAGSALTQTRIVPAPEDLHLELIGVPVGADVALEVRFEAVSEGVLATGTAIAPLTGECARCLTPLSSSVTASFQELYLYADGRHDKHDRHNRHDEQDEQDDEGIIYELVGDLLDLEPVPRDAVVPEPAVPAGMPGGLSRAVFRVRGPPRGRSGPPARRGRPRWAATQHADLGDRRTDAREKRN